MDIAEVWEICIKFMWDKSYVTGLNNFLTKNKVKTILDCGGGTGFPSIPLKKLGWDISYCDNNSVMVRHFQKELQKQNLRIPTYTSSWMQLSKNIKENFDAILCRGNSLIYVNSWDINKPELNKENIRKTLQEFHKKLNENGLVYIDLINKKEFHREKYPILEEIGEKIIDGKKIKITWGLFHDYDKKIRKCNIIMKIDDETKVTTLYSYLLEHSELINLMKEIGFKDVKEVNIDGEENYNVIVGYK